MIQIYTDGACKGNPGAGGWAAILKHKSYRKEISGGCRLTTNNRMEILAVIKALSCLKQDGQQIIVYSDSQYVVNAIEKGWLERWKRFRWLNKFDGKKVKNIDLWKQLDALCAIYKPRFIWVRGHNGDPENERCDLLARLASNDPQEIDEEFESLWYR